MSAAATMDVVVPESQRLIAVSLGKIAASRGQRGGINLHKNLLVATVLHKARTAYMIQHFAKQRAAQSTTDTTTTTTTTESVEMKEQPSNVSQPSSSSSSPVTAAAPTFPPSPPSAAPRAASVAPTPETGSAAPGGADVSPVQVAECDDKENTPPPPPSPSHPVGGDAATPSPACEKRLQGDKGTADKGTADPVKDSREKHASLSVRSPMTHAQQSRRDYVSSQSLSSSPSSCSSCILKRRRTMERDHENVSAPKVRILEWRGGSADQAPAAAEPMQCDSPQISNLVNIFNTSFSGLSGAAAVGAAGGEVCVRSVVGQSILSSVAGHKLAENMSTCAKEMKLGLDSCRQPLVLSV